MTATRKREVLLPAILAAVLAFAAAPVAAQDAVGEKAAAPEEGEAELKVIHMVAENWKFTPDEIRVKKGTVLRLEIQSYGAPHSFVLKPYRIKEPLPQNKKTTVEFVADKPGKFKWRCGRPCGDGCAKMTGKLVVTE